MNINTESRFAVNPTSINMMRSKFNRDSRHKTTFNTGELIPIYVDEALPGDTFQMDMAHVIRMSTSIHPTMDNSYFEVYAFAVPYRLVMEHFKELMGENTTSKWEQTTEYEIPQITAPENTGWKKGTIADHFGLRTNTPGISVSALPFRAYALIVNEWFRDQNLQDPAYLSLDETTQTGTNGSNYITDIQNGGMPFNVGKYHDYFTSALPEPQKGPDVMLPLGTSAPVYGTGGDLQFAGTPGTNLVIRTKGTYGEDQTGTLDIWNRGKQTQEQTVGLSLATKEANKTPSIYTDLTQATAAKINDLRQAIAIQHLYETDARGGTRYREIIKAHFGVVSPDARQQVPEFLGGIKTPLNVDQVVQTSGTQTENGTQTTPQGNVTGFTHAGDTGALFTKSFTEHTIVMVLACVRTLHTYQQGIERMWFKKKRLDFYWPEFANLGEQAILNQEIFAQGTDKDKEAFGYQEPWAEYRYKPSIITGELRSDYEQTLDSWHYGDNYSKLPTLSNEWIQETKNNVDRTLAVQSSVADQFILDIAFKLECTRPMPVYGIPGLDKL